MNNNVIDKDLAKALVNKWKAVLDFESPTIAPIKESHKRTVTATLLENESRWLAEAGLTASSGGVFGDHQPTAGAFSGDGYAKGDARLPKVLIPMIRRTFPELITNEIVGVQPMSGPVGLAFALRYTYDSEPLNAFERGPFNVKHDADGNPKGYGEDYSWNNEMDGHYNNGKPGETWWEHKDSKGNPLDPDEAGYNRLFTDFTGITTTAFDVDEGAIKQQLIDAGVDTDTAKARAKAAAALIHRQDKGIARLMSQFEMTGRIPQMSIKLEKTSVEAGTRRIAANWSTELEQDLKAMNGINIDAEMTNALSYEIQAEIDREMLTRMIHICLSRGGGYANPAKGKGYSFWDAETADGRWFAERQRDFYNRLIIEANRMAILNRRGPANFIVATPRVCAMLEMMPDFKVVTTNTSVNTQQTGVAKVGTVGGRFTLYRDTRTEAQYDMGDRDEAAEYALLGYKGAEYYDTGIIFCPYIPVMIQRTIAPNTFSPRIGLMTRYGVVDHIFGAEMFYHLIIVTGLGTGMKTQYYSDGAKPIFL